VSTETDIYIPGYLKCDKCAFGGMFSVLHAADGEVGSQDVTGRHVCPNDGSDLRRVTWRERANDWAKAYENKTEEATLWKDYAIALHEEANFKLGDGFSAEFQALTHRTNAARCALQKRKLI